jgi:hypothetical protein
MALENKKLQLPKSYAQFLERPDGFVDADKATVSDWKTAVRLAKEDLRQSPAGAKQLIRLAEFLRIPEDVALLPRLRALANKERHYATP